MSPARYFILFASAFCTAGFFYSIAYRPAGTILITGFCALFSTILFVIHSTAIKIPPRR